MPKVWMGVLSAALRTRPLRPECLSALVAGYTLTAAPVSTRNGWPDT